MAGSIALSLTQRYDKTTHLPLDGGRVTFYAAGTTTPQSAYQDISLTIPWPNPLTLDSGGNVPQLFFADGYIKFRLANSAGATQIEADFVLVLGPTSGGGAAPSVDATTVMQPGFIAPYYGTGVRTGFVRANGRTIGNAASGASERANADTAPLYEVLYADPNLAVSGGRGASMAADYAANKTIALPDWRGRTIAGLDDMGSTAAGRITIGVFGTDPTVLGASGGLQTTTIVQNNLPNLALGLTGSITVTGGTKVSQGDKANALLQGGLVAFDVFTSGTMSTGILTSTSSNLNSAFTASMNGNVFQQAMPTLPPVKLTTIYLKL